MRYKLSEILTIIGGGTPKTTNPSFWGGDIPWLSVVDFNNDNRYVHSTEKTITEAGLKHSSTKILPKGSLILSARGTVGALAQLSKPMAFNQSCYGIVATEHTTNDFLYYLLKTVVSDLQAKGHGSVFNTITRETFETIFVSLPQKDEQKRIAGVLGAFDDKIELLQKQNTTLENMAKALFKSWFVDFDVVHAKQQGQPKAAVMQQYHLTEELYNLFPSSFEPSALGPIPTGWQVKTAQEIANILIGRTPPRKESKWFSNNSKNHVWISIKDLGNCGIFINNSSEYLTEEAVNKFRIPMIPANTVVLSFKLTVGRVAISGRNMLSNEAIAQFQNSILPPSYLYFTLKNTNFSSLGSTSSIATAINSNTIKHMDILVANTQIIDIFTNEVEPLFNKIQTNNKQIQTLTEMRDALLPRLISGKIRI